MMVKGWMNPSLPNVVCVFVPVVSSARYHDFAAGLKMRGSGIGFAGVGAKISFNVANRVVTETASHSFRGGSNWQLEANGRLYWDDIVVTSLIGTGTRVAVHFDSNSKPSYTTTVIELTS